MLHGHLGELAAEQFHQLVGHFSRLLLGVGLETELVPDLLRGDNGVGMAAVRLTLVLQGTLLVGGRLIAAAAIAGSRCIVAAIELALAARAFVTIGAKLFLRRCIGWHLLFWLYVEGRDTLVVLVGEFLMALFMGPLRYRGSRLFFQFAFFRPSCKSGWTCWFRLTVVRSAVSRGVECVCLQFACS